MLIMIGLSASFKRITESRSSGRCDRLAVTGGFILEKRLEPWITSHF